MTAVIKLSNADHQLQSFGRLKSEKHVVSLGPIATFKTPNGDGQFSPPPWRSARSPQNLTTSKTPIISTTRDACLISSLSLQGYVLVNFKEHLVASPASLHDVRLNAPIRVQHHMSLIAGVRSV